MLYRIYRLAFSLDLYGVRLRSKPLRFPARTVRDEVREAKERLRVNASMGARA